jgi:hypothetical protein
VADGHEVRGFPLPETGVACAYEERVCVGRQLDAGEEASWVSDRYLS